MEGLVKIPEAKERNEAKDPKELQIWFSLINSNKQGCAKASNSVTCTVKLWQWPLTWTALCQLFRCCAGLCGVRGVDGKKVLRWGKGRKPSENIPGCEGGILTCVKGVGLRNKVWRKGMKWRGSRACYQILATFSLCVRRCISKKEPKLTDLFVQQVEVKDKKPWSDEKHLPQTVHSSVGVSF